jgi:hypothetical protein
LEFGELQEDGVIVKGEMGVLEDREVCESGEGTSDFEILLLDL